MWERRKLLIWGTTYPEFSKKYYETVCTGAIDAETKQLIRIYPITLRHLENRFRQYSWIEADITRNRQDPRPESYRINQDSITVLERLDTADGWRERSSWVLDEKNIFDSVEHLLARQSRDRTSLGLVKPAEILDIRTERRPASDRRVWEEKRRHALLRRDFFVDSESTTRELRYTPIFYKVRFRCNDRRCKTHNLSIRDWGVYQLGRRLYRSRPANEANEGVVDRIRTSLDLSKKDAYLFLGNTPAHPQSFMVVGLYYPPLRQEPAQLSMAF